MTNAGDYGIEMGISSPIRTLWAVTCECGAKHG